ncbi:MAG: DNA repair protein RecN [Cyanobacteria bacterium P01_C01_bin.89]
MLLALRIENFALIDTLAVDFTTGLQVFTGETGAGKSIILDAIDAVLGGKVTARMVRSGASQSSLTAEFAVAPPLEEFLASQGVELADAEAESKPPEKSSGRKKKSTKSKLSPPAESPEKLSEKRLICNLEITVVPPKEAGKRTSIRSRFKLNGKSSSKQVLGKIRDRLVEIAAQGQTVQLLQSDRQRDWLDNFGGESVLPLKQQVTETYEAARAAQALLAKRQAADELRQQQLDLYRFQYDELSAAELEDADELDELIQERDRLSNVVELQKTSYGLYQLLYGDGQSDSCADLLGQAEKNIESIVDYDTTELEPILEMITGALAQVSEAGQAINLYGDRLESDPQRLGEVEERIVFLKGLCRRYGLTLAETIQKRDELQEILEELDEEGQSVEALQEAAIATQKRLNAAAAQLTEKRQEVAQNLEQKLVDQLAPLAMDHVQFQVQFDSVTPTADGGDRITYCFSPNPGEPLAPLGETASGGEMSRFLLALKACFSKVSTVGTLIFDEIDVGVSGRVAQAIAQKLHQLAQNHQVLCVTHQPIVAAMGDRHFHVEKRVEKVAVANGEGANAEASDARVDDKSDLRTLTHLSILDEGDRRLELAQLVSGAENRNDPTGATLAAANAFADSLLERAALLRKDIANKS